MPWCKERNFDRWGTSASVRGPAANRWANAGKEGGATIDAVTPEQRRELHDAFKPHIQWGWTGELQELWRQESTKEHRRLRRLRATAQTALWVVAVAVVAVGWYRWGWKAAAAVAVPIAAFAYIAAVYAGDLGKRHWRSWVAGPRDCRAAWLQRRVGERALPASALRCDDFAYGDDGLLWWSASRYDLEVLEVAWVLGEGFGGNVGELLDTAAAVIAQPDGGRRS